MVNLKTSPKQKETATTKAPDNKVTKKEPTSPPKQPSQKPGKP